MKKDDIKKTIINSFHEKKNSHAFLLSTNNINEASKDVIDIVKKINCDNQNQDNCSCNICHLIDTNSNPDLIVVKPEKDILTQDIEEILKRFTTKPMINKYSVYVIINAERMNVKSSNKILKFLEEPEGEIIGFFITDNPEKILTTIKSRCTIYNLEYERKNILDFLDMSESDFDEYYNFSIELLKNLNETKKYLLMSNTQSMKKFDRVGAKKILNILKRIYTLKYENLISGLYEDIDFVKNVLSIIETNDIKKIVKRIELLDNIIESFNIPVNEKLYLSKLFMEWE